MIEYGESGTLRVNSNSSYLEHYAICRNYKDKLSLVEYRHKHDKSNFCEYDIRGLVSILDHFARGAKASAEDLVTLMHGILLTLICGKKLGLIENSFVLVPEFVFIRRGSFRPKLMYLPMDTSYRQADGYRDLICFLSEVCDDADVLACQLTTALMKIGHNLNEAALVVVDVANNKRVNEIYLDKAGRRPQSTLFPELKKGAADTWSQAESDKSIELLEATCLYEEEPRLYLLDGNERVEIEITSENFTLGRKRDAVDYCFEGEKHRGVSRIHAAIKFDGASFFIEDLGSSGGTFVNGNKIPKGHVEPLLSGDEIKLYTTKLLFE